MPYIKWRSDKPQDKMSSASTAKQLYLRRKSCPSIVLPSLELEIIPPVYSSATTAKRHHKKNDQRGYDKQTVDRAPSQRNTSIGLSDKRNSRQPPYVELTLPSLSCTKASSHGTKATRASDDYHRSISLPGKSHCKHKSEGKDSRQYSSAPVSTLHTIAQGWIIENPYQTLGSISESSGYAHLSRSKNIINTDLNSQAVLDYEPQPTITRHSSNLELSLAGVTTSPIAGSRSRRNIFTKRVRDMDFPREHRRRSFDQSAGECAEIEAAVRDYNRRASVPAQLIIPSALHLQHTKQGAEKRHDAGYAADDEALSDRDSSPPTQCSNTLPIIKGKSAMLLSNTAVATQPGHPIKGNPDVGCANSNGLSRIIPGKYDIGKYHIEEGSENSHKGNAVCLLKKRKDSRGQESNTKSRTHYTRHTGARMPGEQLRKSASDVPRHRPNMQRCPSMDNINSSRPLSVAITEPSSPIQRKLRSSSNASINLSKRHNRGLLPPLLLKSSRSASTADLTADTPERTAVSGSKSAEVRKKSLSLSLYTLFTRGKSESNKPSTAKTPIAIYTDVDVTSLPDYFAEQYSQQNSICEADEGDVFFEENAEGRLTSPIHERGAKFRIRSYSDSDFDAVEENESGRSDIHLLQMVIFSAISGVLIYNLDILIMIMTLGTEIINICNM